MGFAKRKKIWRKKSNNTVSGRILRKLRQRWKWRKQWDWIEWKARKFEGAQRPVEIRDYKFKEVGDVLKRKKERKKERKWSEHKAKKLLWIYIVFGGKLARNFPRLGFCSLLRCSMIPYILAHLHTQWSHISRRCSLSCVIVQAMIRERVSY